jgi:NADP-dependent 3-hydroxy acid dehydrogenase YdfG
MVSTNSPPRRALVTGASSGIGQATVRALIGAGWSVIGVARRADKLAALRAETGCDVLQADITSESEVQGIHDYVADTGGISALVNNAGVAVGNDHVVSANSDDWLEMLSVNVIGTQRVTKALISPLRTAALAGGVADIVTISSTAAFVSYEGGGGYNAAKAGIHAMLGALRLELSGEPIRVVEIAPGMVKTEEFALKRFGGDKEKTQALYQDVQEPLLAEDIADLVRYALSLPAHVNLDLVQVKPVAQAMQYKLHRGPLAPKI